MKEEGKILHFSHSPPLTLSLSAPSAPSAVKKSFYIIIKK
jgi:hypothetical protein